VLIGISKPVQIYTPVDQVAKRLRVTAEKLLELASCGWISIVEKNGKLCIAQNHQYKAKFILRLQHFLKLSPCEISDVLSYRNVARLLEEIGKPNTEIEPFHEGAD
jgi:hypothetical protein